MSSCSFWLRYSYLHLYFSMTQRCDVFHCIKYLWEPKQRKRYWCVLLPHSNCHVIHHSLQVTTADCLTLYQLQNSLLTTIVYYLYLPNQQPGLTYSEKKHGVIRIVSVSNKVSLGAKTTQAIFYSFKHGVV